MNYSSPCAVVPRSAGPTGSSAGSDAPAEPWDNHDRLDSWKEIASYLKREVRTVQLWEKNEGLPVHRQFHKRLGSVFALRSEIEKWRREVSGAETGDATTFKQVNVRCSPLRVYVLPIQNLSSRRELRDLCKPIVASTLQALQQIDPGQLTASLSDHAVPSGQKGEYSLGWNLEDQGAEVNVRVSLESLSDRKVIWSFGYQCERLNWKHAPAQVAEQIVQCVWLKLISLPKAAPQARAGGKRGAHEAYLKGRYFWKQRRHESLRKAIQCFESASSQDPQSALPYSGLADSLTLLSFYEIVPPSKGMPAARRAALKAIELDPNLAEAHVSLADVLLHFDRDWQGADREYRRAIQCNPDYALGYHWYSNLLAAKGQHQAAHLAVMNALELDPVSVITLVWAGVTSYLARRFDDAVLHYKNALELEPDFVWAHMYMAQALEQKGEFGEALREFETAIRLADGNNCVRAMKAHSHALAGDKNSARGILRELRETSFSECMPSYDIAATYAALADPDRMIAWLDRACQERNMKLFTLPQDPRFDPYRSRTEFQEVVARIGLGQA